MEKNQTRPFSFELGPIRPPSEAYSLLIRATRNCPWNKCKFCHTYKECVFELRSVDEIKGDISAARRIYDEVVGIASQPGTDTPRRMLAIAFNEAFSNVARWHYAGGENVFLQDANCLIMKTDELAEVIRFIKKTFPNVKRITSYGRSQTVCRKRPEELTKLYEAGLSRLHIGLESGYDPLLQYMNKGVTAAQHIEGGRKVVESKISLCEYVVLGLGGKHMWEEHALNTARVLNEINPDFIRVRTLCVNSRMPLNEDVQCGNFVRANDEEIIREERTLIENLECHSNFVSDHISNLLPEIEGKLPDDKSKMLDIIDKFETLPTEERANFIVGRRMGVYSTLKDMNDLGQHERAERIRERLSRDGKLDWERILAVMEEFI